MLSVHTTYGCAQHTPNADLQGPARPVVAPACEHLPAIGVSEQHTSCTTDTQHNTQAMITAISMAAT